MQLTQLKQLSAENYIAEFSNGETFKTVFSVVADYSLYTGRELDDAEFAAVKAASELGRAKNRAMRIIGAAPMSEMSLYERLVSKGESEQNAAQCVAWLKSLGYLDDISYAKNLVRHYAAKGYGRNRVRDELYRRRVPREIWDEALEEMPEQDDKIDSLLRSKLRGEKPDRKELKRATDALMRRGFSWSEIKSAVSRYNDSIEEDY